MTHDIDLAAEFDDGASEPEHHILPPVSEMYGADATPDDLDLEALLAVATSPDTPAPEGDLIPDSVFFEETEGPEEADHLEHHDFPLDDFPIEQPEPEESVEFDDDFDSDFGMEV